MKKNNISIMMLKTLASLQQTKSISRTADQLNVTQSAISHTIRALEAITQTPVLIREPRGVSLTAAGLNACQSAQVALKAINDIVQLNQSSPSGLVRLATVVSASRVILPDVLALTGQAYPQIEVSLLIGTDSEVHQWVKEGIADIGLAYMLKQSSKTSETLFDDLFYLVTPANQVITKISPQSQTAGIKLSDLSDHEFIMSSSGCLPIIQNIFDQSNAKLNVKASVSDISALFALVGSGYGISIVPELAFPADWQKQVQRHVLNPELKYAFGMTSTQDSSPRIEALKGLIRQVTNSIKG